MLPLLTMDLLYTYRASLASEMIKVSVVAQKIRYRRV